MSPKSHDIDHFTRCKQHWSRNTYCFSFWALHKSWDKIQLTEHIKLNQKVKQTSLRCFLYMWNKENTYKLKQEVLLDQCCLHLVKWSIESHNYEIKKSHNYMMYLIIDFLCYKYDFNQIDIW